MSKREPSILITDIIESGVKILHYTEGMTYESFLEDSKTIDAVIRNFEIIGEAANRLPEDYKEKYPHIDWFKISGFRNRIVYDYMGIDYGIVWLIKEQFLPDLINKNQDLS
jgi:uncharacterized protein with HEPN domain